MARVAAVDLGTNSTRLLAADISEGRIRDLERQTHVTRLGEGVDGRRRLLPLPIARVRNVLSDYRRIAETLGVERTLAIGTSAVRDAENGEAFLGEIEWSYGFATLLLSGDDEAVAVNDRDWMHDVFNAPTAPQRLTAYAGAVRRILEHAGDMFVVVATAAIAK